MSDHRAPMPERGTIVPLPPPSLARPESHGSPPNPSGQPSVAPAGWYRDPTRSQGWRWWDGNKWTGYQHEAARKPMLPRVLSWPVVIAAPLVLIGLVLVAINGPQYILAALVPAVIVAPVFVWLDRVEPEPLASRIHAVLWGGTVAVMIAVIVNVITAAVAGEIVAAVVSAPLIEEAAKGLGIVWAVRRRELDSMSDGVIYAGFVALGFAIVEDVEYFLSASQVGNFGAVFVLRGLLTPFSHPLFTVWTGIAIGREVVKGRGINPRILWGYGLAVLAHAAWNGSITVGELVGNEDETIGAVVVLVALAMFILLFVATAVGLVVMRNAERRIFDKIAPYLVQQFGLEQWEQATLYNYKAMIAARRKYPARARRTFDAVRAAVARLAAVYERNGSDELKRVYATQFFEARRALAERVARPK